MPTQSQPEATGTATPATGAEGEAANQDESTQAGTAQGDAGASAGAAAQGDGAEGAAAEGQRQDGEGAEKTPEQIAQEKAAAEAKETELKAAGEKYAKEQIAQANRTMAAARRAEAAVAEVKTQNTALKKENEILNGFVQQLQKQPLTALGRLGFKSFQEFAQYCVDNGEGEGGRQPTEEERIAAAVRKAIDEREAPRTKAEQERAVKESQDAVFAFVDADKVKYARTATHTGKAKLWEAIGHYHEKHGTVPDEAVAFLADSVERELRADFGDPVSPGPGAKKGTPASGAAAPGASSSGASLAGQPTSGAPVLKPLSLDPDERRAQVNAELRAQNLL